MLATLLHDIQGSRKCKKNLMKDLLIYICEKTHKSALNDLTKKKYAQYQFSLVLAPPHFQQLMLSVASITLLAATMPDSVIHGELIRKRSLHGHANCRGDHDRADGLDASTLQELQGVVRFHITHRVTAPREDPGGIVKLEGDAMGH